MSEAKKQRLDVNETSPAKAPLSSHLTGQSGPRAGSQGGSLFAGVPSKGSRKKAESGMMTNLHASPGPKSQRERDEGRISEHHLGKRNGGRQLDGGGRQLEGVSGTAAGSRGDDDDDDDVILCESTTGTTPPTANHSDDVMNTNRSQRNVTPPATTKVLVPVSAKTRNPNPIPRGGGGSRGGRGLRGPGTPKKPDGEQSFNFLSTRKKKKTAKTPSAEPQTQHNTSMALSLASAGGPASAAFSQKSFTSLSFAKHPEDIPLTAFSTGGRRSKVTSTADALWAKEELSDVVGGGGSGDVEDEDPLGGGGGNLPGRNYQPVLTVDGFIMARQPPKLKVHALHI